MAMIDLEGDAGNHALNGGTEVDRPKGGKGKLVIAIHNT